MKAKGIDGSIYSHPIGLHGHGAGPLIGLWDYQDGVVGRGEAKVIPSMWWSIELQATTPVPEWNGQPVRMAQEEDAIIGATAESDGRFGGRTSCFSSGRPETPHLYRWGAANAGSAAFRVAADRSPFPS
jgi:hypothetical protein